MICLTRLNHVPLVLNSDLIEHLEVTPDTVITLTSGQKLMVLEPAAEVIRRVTAFRRSVYQHALCCPLVRLQEPDPDTPGEAL
ncbi:MAG: flagellar FlbD family protein [Acidobacteria bacterium]|nr:flagellar FlbD family protein [Acidobacteriota bacterium]